MMFLSVLSCGGGSLLQLHLLNRLGDSVDRLVELLPGDNEWRLHSYYVAIHPTDTDQHSGGEAVVADRFSRGSCGRLIFIKYEFDTYHQSEPSDFSDQRLPDLELVEPTYQI